MMKLTCISCPRGCRMVVERKGEEIVVTGNECKRGEEYAVAELT
ncbi:MAG: molybdopterin oxidoreductase, partial [Clostridiales bacterium]|nr:molybdopterin oxidoreductase [Clostridiales bacterium]